MTDFSDWLEKCFLKWQNDLGARKTITEFAEYLNVSQAALSNWMNGKYKPKGAKNVRSLAGKLGLEVYDVLGMDRPEELDQPWNQLPPELRRRLRTALREINATYRAREISPDEDEALSIAEEVLSKYGFTVSETEKSEDEE